MGSRRVPGNDGIFEPTSAYFSVIRPALSSRWNAVLQENDLGAKRLFYRHRTERTANAPVTFALTCSFCGFI
jgi:hypothetical protein